MGTGYPGLAKTHPQTEQQLTSSGVELTVAKTEKACETYDNLSNSRKVVAAFHSTC